MSQSEASSPEQVLLRKGPWRLAQAFGACMRIAASERGRVEQATILLRCAEGDSFDRSFAKFLESDGARLLESKPDSLSIIRDEAALWAQPLGSLGNAYARFARDEGVSWEFYAHAAAAGGVHETDPDRKWYRRHTGVMHDLRHLLTGYHTDDLGEACVIFFAYGQTGHRGVMALSVLALLNSLLRGRRGVFKACGEAYRRGRAAKLLEIMPWETALDRSLAEYRAEYGLKAPIHYRSQLFDDASAEPGPVRAS